ncbi:hypothetical protein NODU109028_10955 [Nocardioides dubius]|uniref:Sulfotransferase family protein n=1 Tax=Nocardioides dubius TaxID=317019 RepID=A0ABP4ECY2_9ACTN
MSASPEGAFGPTAHVLHIGPHKTGSTAVQAALFHQRDDLPAHGLYVPQHKQRRRQAGWALGLEGGPAGVPRPPMHRWNGLVAEVAAVEGLRVCVSNEDFGRASPEQARQLVDGLGGDDPQIVAAVRNLDRLLPSLWQERVKAGIDTGYEDWLKVVLGDDPNAWEKRDALGFHDVEEMVQRWVDVVGADRFTLVVIDDKDPGDLLSRFETLLGLPLGLLKGYPGESNRGLTYAEAEMMRAFNALAEKAEVPRPLRARYLNHGFVRAFKASAQRSPGPSGAPHPAWAWEWIEQQNKARADFVASCGVRVLGSVESLRVMRPPVQVPADWEPHVPIELIAEGLFELIQKVDLDKQRTALQIEQLTTPPAPASLLSRVARRLRRR